MRASLDSAVFVDRVAQGARNVEHGAMHIEPNTFPAFERTVPVLRTITLYILCNPAYSSFSLGKG